MDKYVPFLKFKKNEVMTVRELSSDLIEQLTPFFDLPRRQNPTEANFVKQVKDAVADVGRHLSGIRMFYLDNFDIDSGMTVGGNDTYEFILTEFAGLPVIPVTGLDRTASQIKAINDALDAGGIQDGLIALRLNSLDYEDYAVVESELQDLFGAVCSRFTEIDLILDMRVVRAANVTKHIDCISAFAPLFASTFPCRKVIVTGSVLPASIADLISVNSELIVERAELEAFNQIAANLAGSLDLWLGDYTVVSPDYSDVDMPPEMLRNITAPKVVYSFERYHFIRRGRALRQYGNDQYNDIADELIQKPFYRGAAFSWGDQFFYDKSQSIGSQVTPSTVVKPGVNAHICYMLNSY